MKIEINDKAYEVPFDPTVITLGQYSNWYEEFGKELDVQLLEIIKKEYEDIEDKMIDLDNHMDRRAVAWFSFWTGLDLSVIANTPGGLDMCNAYKTLEYLLRGEEEDVALPKTYDWGGEKWEIKDFKINPASDMAVNEIITSKEVERQLQKLDAGKPRVLKYLAAIYFRKEGEGFRDEFIHEGSERLGLMETLPLAYAYNLSFFLRICVNFWKKTLQSSTTSLQEV